MYPIPLLSDVVKTARNQRPNARVLVIEARAEDLPVTIEWLRNCGMPAGDGNTNPVLVLTARQYVQRRRTVGPVDIVVPHNQYNILRADQSPSMDTALKYLRAQRHSVRVIHMEPEHVLGVAPVLPGWRCGEPFVLRVKPMQLTVPAVSGEPCGYRNHDGVWHCAACDRFRGLSYGESQ